MNTKKLLTLILAAVILAATPVSANAKEHFEIAQPYRYLTFASDGGSFIKALERPVGAYVNLESYVPVKDGHTFDGWYSDPRTKECRVEDVILTENIVVYAKWICDDETVILQSEESDTPKPLAANEVTAYGDHVDEKTGAPVTALWVWQNSRLEELMKQYDLKFNR